MAKSRKAGMGKKPQKEKTRKKARLSKLAQCIRKTSASARITKTGMPDSATYNPQSLTLALSGKFNSLINKIRELDTADFAQHGHLFKHFIFTDIRESAYGAKALAGFLIAAGFDFRMTSRPKMIKRHGKLVPTKHGEAQLTHPPAVPGGSNGFALLQSLPLWKTPLLVPIKKDILNTFNSRPDNVNGELLRIIVLDSKFKEGIDLKDVKYVHLLEPPIAVSDLKQAVGRATRFCGQSGLHFIPRRGWPLYVYTYRTELPGRPPFVDSYGEQKVDAHALMLKHSGLDLAMMNLTKELTVLAINTAVDYDLNFKINNFSIEEEILEAVDDEAYLAEIGMTGGVRKGRPVVGLYKVEDLTPKFLAKCFKRSSKLFPFSKKQLRSTAVLMGYKIPNTQSREFYCRLLQKDPDYLYRMQTAPANRIREKYVRRPISPLAAEPELPTIEDAKSTHRPESRTSYFSAPLLASNISDPSVRSVVKSVEAGAASAKPEKFRIALSKLKNLPFSEFQTAVASLYAMYKWDSPVVENGCGIVAAQKQGAPVSFTRTQDFVRHYLIPESPFKGLLAWHSVGTGKTCMAVAAASSDFEAAGYTILWVTRNALMSDVYKNIFGAVCSIPIMEAVEAGASVPTDLTAAKRMLSRAWLPPITYRMLQNALQGKNELGRMLAAKNRADPLHKTFLIMDEVHKLMDGDLSAAESADFSVIQNFIHKSYAASGANSVRPLLMTATPITDTPRELFAILNTLIGSPSSRLMDFEDFRKKYTTDSGEITTDGCDYFQERAKGLISYLNREYDPTTFAQPVFEDVLVPVGGVSYPAVEELVSRCLADTDAPAGPSYDDCDGIEEEMEAELYELKEASMKPKAYEKAVMGLKKTYKKRRVACEKRNATKRKAHDKAVKAYLKTAGGCWTAQKKLFTASKGPSQLAEVEACFGKKGARNGAREAYPSKPAFLDAVRSRLASMEETNTDSVRSNTGAVFNNNNSSA
jgi:hypothetical protein